MPQNPAKTLGALLALATAANLLSSTHLNAAIVVDWGGNYVAGDAGYSRAGTGYNFGLDGTSVGRTRYLAFDTDTALNPTTGYTVPTGKSGTFYGGYLSSWTGTLGTSPSASANLTVVRNDNTNGDRMMIRSQIAPGTGGSITQRHSAFAIAFKQSDFLNGNSTGTLRFDTTSSLSMNVQTAQFTNVRFMVQMDNANWYVSETAFTGTGLKTLDNTTATKLVDERWALFSPTNTGSDAVKASSLFFDSGAATFGALSGVGITAVGFYAQHYSTSDVASKDIGIQNFTADIAPIPEPSAFAALVGLGAIGIAATRRRRT